MYKKKKVTKYRGSKTHGCGSMKKRRGAGHRGGRGRSGSGKRGDQKKPMYWKDKVVKGFSSKSTLIINPINLKDLNQRIDSFVIAGKAKALKNAYEIDLKDIGCNKLLGTGVVTKKIMVKAKFASEKAKQKLEAAGGGLVDAPE